MAERISETLQKKLSDRLSFYDDLGIQLFYRDRGAVAVSDTELQLEPHAVARLSTSELQKEVTLSKPAGKPVLRATAPVAAPVSPKIASLPVAAGPSLFEAVDKIADDTLLKVREDLGECARCKLHSTRHKIVFGDGNPKARLVFVGEGPGADEDALGLQRKDVYICNVVKCRPPENRQPEEDEVSTCSPFLFRQIDVIAPKVIVCLGAVAAKTLLQTNRGISQFRGEWLEFRGRKLLATYHPAYLLRNPPAKSEVWKDLQKVMAVLGLEVKKGKSSS